MIKHKLILFILLVLLNGLTVAYMHTSLNKAVKSKVKQLINFNTIEIKTIPILYNSETAERV